MNVERKLGKTQSVSPALSAPCWGSQQVVAAVTSGYTIGANKMLLANQLNKQLITACLKRLGISMTLALQTYSHLCGILF